MYTIRQLPPARVLPVALIAVLSLLPALAAAATPSVVDAAWLQRHR